MSNPPCVDDDVRTRCCLCISTQEMLAARDLKTLYLEKYMFCFSDSQDGAMRSGKGTMRRNGKQKVSSTFQDQTRAVLFASSRANITATCKPPLLVRAETCCSRECHSRDLIPSASAQICLMGMHSVLGTKEASTESRHVVVSSCTLGPSKRQP